MAKHKIIIAVDGLSASGKSTLSKKLADQLGYRYIDTGAMYRAVAYHAYKNNFFNAEGALDLDMLETTLPDVEIAFNKNSSGHYSIHLDGQDVEAFIRGEEVSKLVSEVAKQSFVREALTVQQRCMGREKEIVMDGRDIGSIVFPEAELKFYVTADSEVRARRRYEQLKHLGAKYEDVLEGIVQRDFEDLNREQAPLVKLKEAIEVDNSIKTIEQQIAFMYQIAADRIQGVD